MKVLLLLLFFYVYQGLVLPQASLKTTGPCSAIVQGNHNVIDCGAMSKKEAQQLSDVLTLVRTSNITLEQIKDMISGLHDDVTKVMDPYRPIRLYTRQGWLKTQIGMKLTSDAGETEQFKVAMQLESERDWQGLAKWAELEKTKVPTWFSALYFAAEAYNHLCNLNKERQNLEAFVHLAADVEDYDQDVIRARHILDLWSKGAYPHDCSK